MIIDRLQRLNAATQELVVCAALLGYRPDVAALAACGNVAPEAATAALEQACGVDLAILESRTPPAYRFRHALTQAALRDALGPETRRSLHARIARRLEELADAADRTEQLAYHWLGAGEAERASLYWQRAAERAVHLGADGDARTFASRARDAADRMT